MTNHTNLLAYLEAINTLETTENEARENMRRTNSKHRQHRLVAKDSLQEESNIESLKYSIIEKQGSGKSIYDRAVVAFSSNPRFMGYKLTERDLSLVAAMYCQCKEDYNFSFHARDLILMARSAKLDLHGRAAYITGLVDRHIVNYARSICNDYHYEPAGILEGHFCLDSYFFNLLIGTDPFAEACAYLKENLGSSSQAMRILGKAFKTVFSYYGELLADNMTIRGFRYGGTVRIFMDKVCSLVKALDEQHPLNKFISRYDLSKPEFQAFLLVFSLEMFFDTRPDSTMLANLLSTTEEEFEGFESFLSPTGIFVKKGLVEYERHSLRAVGIGLTDASIDELNTIDGLGNPTQCDMQAAIKRSRHLSILDTSQTIGQLILPEAQKKILTSIIQRLKDPQKYDLSRWGLLTASLSKDTKSLSNCNILLHGHPGTGKTLAAGVIANELGRKLVQINPSTIRDCYYGQTEKMARKLFKELREICESNDLAPVFLINEADQLLHNRMDIGQTADSTENTIQSIFLEEMETFPGIMVVTTNLLNNLDIAMSRRFAYKLEFYIPDQDCRYKLWQVHLPATIPGVNALDIHTLASNYEFTGGQIRIVVQNACAYAMQRGNKSKLLMSDLIQFANLESGSSFEVSKKRIGFANRE